jgi:hypothetical protein
VTRNGPFKPIGPLLYDLSFHCTHGAVYFRYRSRRVRPSSRGPLVAERRLRRGEAVLPAAVCLQCPLCWHQPLVRSVVDGAVLIVVGSRWKLL